MSDVSDTASDMASDVTDDTAVDDDDEASIADGTVELLNAAYDGDMPTLVSLVVAGGMDPDEGDDEGATAALTAISGGQIEVLIYLVEACGASLAVTDKFGMGPSHYAADHGVVHILKYLAEKSPSLLDEPENTGTSPMMIAAYSGRSDVIRFLARRGCSLSGQNDAGQTALDLAVHASQSESVQLLQDIDTAGGWPEYVAGCRMAYAFIRHEVSRSFRILPGSNKDCKVLHFLFGKNKVGEGAKHTRRASMLTLPGDLFGLVIAYLEG